MRDFINIISDEIVKEEDKYSFLKKINETSLSGKKYLEIFEAVIAYHGTKTPNGRFKSTHIGNNSHTFCAYNSTRYGIFFSDNPKFSAMYGDVGKYQLNIKNTLDLDNDHNFLWNWKNSIDAFKERDLWMTAKYAINHIWELFEDEVGERFTKYLKKHGYDSAKFTEYANNNNEEIKSNTIVILNKNLIKKITK